MKSNGKVKSMKSRAWSVWSKPLTVAAAVVAVLLAEPAAAQTSIWSGVYTQAQNKRGEELYSGACAQCHGLQLNGAGQPDQPPSPAIARAGFLRKWNGKPVAELFAYVRKMMPTDNPGTLTDQQAIDSIAHMFAVSNIPAGGKELPPDAKALEGIVIEEKPKK
jgi:mono/diheme cytochrome c family protein